MKNLNLVSLLTLTLIFSACSKSEEDKSHHFGSATTLVQENVQWTFSEATETALDNAAAAEPSVSQALKPMSSEIKSLSATTNKNIRLKQAEQIRAAIKPLEGVALNPSFVGNTILAKSSKFRTVFKKYTEGLSLLIHTDENYVKDTGLLSAFWAAATQGCDQNLEGCRTLELIMSSSQSSYILESYAWELDGKIQKLDGLLAADAISNDDYKKTRFSLIEKKASVMRLALKTQNSGDDSKERLSLLYLISERQFNEIEGSSATFEPIRRQLINERAMSQLARKLKDEKFGEQITPFLRDRAIWQRFTLRDLRAQKANFGSLQIANDLIKTSCRHFRKDESYTQAMNKSLNDKDAYGKTGFLQEVKEMQKSESNVILSNMRVNNSLASNETLFILDQVYRGHWSMDIAVTCWEAVRGERTDTQRPLLEKELLKMSQDYIRVELVKRIIATNKFMAKVFVPPAGKRKLSSKEVFERALEESLEIKGDWDDLINRITHVDNFVKATLGDVPVDRQSEEHKNFRYMLLSVRNNIKLLAVYPNMLLLSYYLAAKNFSVTFQGWFGEEYVLDAEIIINWIFGEAGDKKAARPLFDFGNDSRPIQTFENLYSFFYALKTNTFNTFAEGDAKTDGSSGEKPISEVNFFSEVTRRYINKEYLELSTAIKQTEDSFVEDESYARLQKICAAESGLRDGVDADYIWDISLEEMSKNTFIPLNSRSVSDIYRVLYGTTISGNMPVIRDLLYRKYLFISAMIEILDDHWKTQLAMAEANPDLKQYKSVIASKAAMESQLKEIRDNFNNMQDVIRRYEFFALSNHRRVGDCIYTLINKENRQQSLLYKREMTFLSSVQDAFIELRERVRANPAREASLDKDYTAAVNGRVVEGATDKMKALASLSRTYLANAGDVEGFDEMSANDGYIYSKWNLLLRSRHNLQEINPNIRIAIPPVLTEVDLYTSAKESNNRISIGSAQMQNPEQFIRLALVSAVKNQFIQWPEATRSLSLLQEKILLMTELYKNTALGIFKTARDSCKQNSDYASCKEDISKFKPVTQQEIIAETFKIAQLINIKPEEEQQLRLLNMRTKFNKSDISSFLLDSREEPRSLLEKPYKLLTGGNQLMLQAKDAIVAFNALLSTGSNDNEKNSSDWMAQSSKELMFLSEHDSVRKITRKLYQPVVKESLKSVNELEAIIQCLNSAITPSDRHKILYELDLKNPNPRSGKYFNVFSGPGNRAELLEDRLKDDYQSFVTEFEKDTKGVFHDADDGTNTKPTVDCRALVTQVN